MTLCPIAIAVGCKKCPAFAVCPLKSVIGDYVQGGARGQEQRLGQGQIRGQAAQVAVRGHASAAVAAGFDRPDGRGSSRRRR